MFGTIRRHQTWLWAVIASLTILSFIVFFDPNQRNRKGGAVPKNFFGTIGGRPIAQEERASAEREVELGYFLQNGVWPDDRGARQNFNVRREAYIRLLELEKERELGIQVSPMAVAQHARDILGPATVDLLVEKILTPRHMTLEDFERYVRHDAARTQLIGIVGLSGKLVTPAEAEELYRKEHQDLSVSLVSFPASNYLAGINVTAQMVASYYSNAQANYSIPKKREVEYVKWDVTNYLAEARTTLTNLDKLVEANYKNGTNGFYKGLKTEPEAKAKVEEDILRSHALLSARRAAGAFADELDLQPHTLASFETLAKAKNLPVKTTEPFDQDAGPAGIEGATKFITAAFSRAPDEPFSGAVDAEDGFYVLALKSEVPSRIPALAEVEAKVTADYRMAQAAQQARLNGTMFASTLTNGLAAGKSFDEIVAQAKVKAQPLPPFSLSTRELPPELEQKVNFPMVKQIAFSVDPGKASPFIPTAEGGVVVYVKAKMPIDEAKLKTELPAFLTYVRQARQNESINQWFMKQINDDKGFSDIWRAVNETPQMQSAARRSKS